jgi:predicted metal-dependent hydrolase
MQLVLPWLTTRRVAKAPRPPKAPAQLQVGTEIFPLTIARHRKARRYILRLTPEGGLRLTVPRGASLEAGLTFARKQGGWIARERARRGIATQPWLDGTVVWFRGERIPLMVDAESVTVGATRIPLRDGQAVRSAIEAHLRATASAELPQRCRVFAAQHGLAPSRVSIRNQRSRWGSCSSRGTIALNWRLIQMPPEVSDYIVLHELMHMRQPNHSRQFWREVASVCEGWREAERWLRTHGRELL